MDGSVWCEAQGWKGRWRTAGTLGVGRDCIAYATHPLHGADTPCCVLKVPKSGAPEGAAERLLAEAEALASLEHPRIPRLLETNIRHRADPSASGEPYLVMDLIPGAPLDRVVAADRCLPEDAALSLAEALLDAVAHCHANRRVHADIKRENVLLRRGDPADPVLIDFNHSVDTDRLTGSAATRVVLDPRSDLTQVARILFFGITGQFNVPFLDWHLRPPHQRPQHQDALRAVPSLRGRRLRELFDRAFSVRLEDRFQSAAELRAALHLVREAMRPADRPPVLRRVPEARMDPGAV